MYWPAPPNHGAEGPLPETQYARALRAAGSKNFLQVPYDTYSRPSMYMGPVGPVPIAGVWYAPQIPIGYPPGELGPVDAYRAQGPLPDPARPAWRPAPEFTWADVIRRRRYGG